MQFACSRKKLELELKINPFSINIVAGNSKKNRLKNFQISRENFSEITRLPEIHFFLGMANGKLTINRVVIK